MTGLPLVAQTMLFPLFIHAASWLSPDNWLIRIAMIAAVAAAASMMHRRRGKEKSVDLSQLASRLSLSFTSKPRSAEITGPLGQLAEVFSPSGGIVIGTYASSSSTFANRMSGAYGGYPVSVFEYFQHVGGSKMTCTVAAIDLVCDLPRFQLKNETFKHKFLNRAGFHDVALGSGALFSGDYSLKGPDEPAVRRIFTPEVTARLGERDLMDGNVIEAGGKKLLLMHNGLLPVSELVAFVDSAVNVAEAFEMNKSSISEEADPAVLST